MDTVQKSANALQSCMPMSDFRLAIGSPMHTISKKLANKREKRARYLTSQREKYFVVASGTSRYASQQRTRRTALDKPVLARRPSTTNNKV